MQKIKGSILSQDILDFLILVLFYIQLMFGVFSFEPNLYSPLHLKMIMIYSLNFYHNLVTCCLIDYIRRDIIQARELLLLVFDMHFHWVLWPNLVSLVVKYKFTVTMLMCSDKFKYGRHILSITYKFVSIKLIIWSERSVCAALVG